MRYQYLLADNDNTLMDFSAAEHHALRETLSAMNVEPDEATCALYSRINDALWKDLERGETTQKALKVERFRQLIEALNRADLDAQAMADLYARRLSTRADLMPGAMAFLEKIRGKMKIALVSNGVSSIQRGRLARCAFTPMLDAVIISEELGVSKPDPAMVYAALEALGCKDKSQAILLGDSASADIPAARNAGIDSIFLDLKGKGSSEATYVVQDLAGAADVLLEE